MPITVNLAVADRAVLEMSIISDFNFFCRSELDFVPKFNGVIQEPWFVCCEIGVMIAVTVVFVANNINTERKKPTRHQKNNSRTHVAAWMF